MNTRRIEAVDATGANVSVKSRPYRCAYPHAVRRLLNLSTCPSDVCFTRNTHLHLIGFAPDGMLERGIIWKTEWVFRESSSRLMLEVHRAAFGPVVAAVKVGGVSYWLARSGAADAVTARATNSGCCEVITCVGGATDVVATAAVVVFPPVCGTDECRSLHGLARQALVGMACGSKGSRWARAARGC